MMPLAISMMLPGAQLLVSVDVGRAAISPSAMEHMLSAGLNHRSWRQFCLRRGPKYEKE